MSSTSIHQLKPRLMGGDDETSANEELTKSKFSLLRTWDRLSLTPESADNLSKIMAAASGVTFSKDQGQIVKESWQILKPNMAQTSVKLFLRILEMAPEVFGMFSFLRDSSVPLENNAKLKAHAMIIFKMTCESAVQLGEQGSLDKLTPTLRRLGHSHHLLRVSDGHFEVVKSAFLISLKEALQDQWSQKVKAAWAEAYDQLTSVMKDEIHVQAQLAAVKV